jgi:aminopeptidase-like protein
MGFKDLLNGDGCGAGMYELARELYPLCRSITGNGVRDTLGIISRRIPLEIHEVPTGTKVFDWVVPREWNINDAYIKDKSGRRVVDFRESNLHVVGYSSPTHRRVSLEELKQHIITLPDQPDLIPYRTSYFNETWGFCLRHTQLCSLTDDEYEICIDSSLKDGHLTYGEYLLPGDSEEEVLLSAHVCHPSLANDNLSGISLLTFLAGQLKNLNARYSYRFIFAPGTIGSIVWLARNEDKLGRVKHGLVISCVGDHGGPTYKRSRRGDADIDKAVEHVLKFCGRPAVVKDFSPYGYDERQYCSPGFNLPVGLFERSEYGQFLQYHTSADNLDFIRPAALAESYAMVAQVINVLENNAAYVNTNPKCEPQLGRRGLYSAIGGDKDIARKQLAMLWVLNQSDGTASLLDIAQKAGIPFEIVNEAAILLKEAGLLR